MTAVQGMPSAASPPPRKRGWLMLGILLAAAGLVVAGANFHLVYVAVSSQPDCVPHLKAPDGQAGTFRAAQPSC